MNVFLLNVIFVSVFGHLLTGWHVSVVLDCARCFPVNQLLQFQLLVIHRPVDSQPDLPSHQRS